MIVSDTEQSVFGRGVATDMEYIVYCHTNKINGKQYIGITSMSFEERCGKEGSRYKNCVAFWNAIQKYEWNNFSHTVLAYDLTREKANELEIYYISKFNTMVPNGYNLSLGGEVYERTEEWRKHMSEAMKGNKSRTGMKNSEKHKKRMSELMKGNDFGKYHKVTPEYIEKIKMSQPNRVVLQQYTKDGIFIAEYTSIKEASRKTGINEGNIGASSRGKLKSAGGFLWKRRGN